MVRYLEWKSSRSDITLCTQTMMMTTWLPTVVGEETVKTVTVAFWSMAASLVHFVEDGELASGERRHLPTATAEAPHKTKHTLLTLQYKVCPTPVHIVTWKQKHWREIRGVGALG